MGERRDSKGPKDVREEASPAARKDPRRDSFQMSMPALVAELTRELVKLKKRIAELEKDLERERTARAKAEDALRRVTSEKGDEKSSEKFEKGDEIASRMTRELRATRKSTMPLSASNSSPPRGSVSPTAQTQPPSRSEHATRRIAAVTRIPSQPLDRKR